VKEIKGTLTELEKEPEAPDEDYVLMMTAEEPPKQYYKLLCEKRRVALAEALEENKKVKPVSKEKNCLGAPERRASRSATVWNSSYKRCIS
jgi:hypothetical protein